MVMVRIAVSAVTTGTTHPGVPAQLQVQVWVLVWGQVWVQMWVLVWGQVWVQVWVQVWGQLWVQLWVQMRV